jgi:hypothetical protein
VNVIMFDTNEATQRSRGRAEVRSGVVRRRRWMAAEKGRIVAQAVAPGAVVAEVARPITSRRSSSGPPIAPRTFLKAAFMFVASGGATSALITCSGQEGGGQAIARGGGGQEGPGRKGVMGRLDSWFLGPALWFTGKAAEPGVVPLRSQFAGQCNVG